MAPTVVVASFFVLGFGAVVCADAPDAVTAVRMAVDTRSVGSLMVGPYPEKNGRTRGPSMSPAPGKPSRRP